MEENAKAFFNRKMKKLFLVPAILLLLMPIALAATTLPTGGTGLRVALTDYDPSPAQPGKYVTLYLKAENSGGDVITNPKFKLELSYPFSLQPGESEYKTTNSLGASEKVLLEYDLYVDNAALAGTYTLNLKLCTNNECTSYAKTPFDVTVRTGGAPRIEVGIEDSDIFSGGKKGTVTLHIINRGLLDTKFLIMELKETEQFQIISPPRIYIGELQSDDFETAEYDIYVKPTVAALESTKIKLPVVIEYSDSNDKEYISNFDVNLDVYSRTDLVKLGLVSNSFGKYVIAIFVFFGLLVGYILFRRHKKKKSAA